jgi:5-(carboxyamino)imidazole ribonucleotide synthase
MSVNPQVKTIGILGGGQLGRMLSISAAQLGIRCHILAPDSESVAGDCAASLTRQNYGEHPPQDFARSIDVLTYEFENVPASAFAGYPDDVRIYPPVRALDIAQSRVAEKQFVSDLGGATAPFAYVESAQELAAAIAQIGVPSILKTNRMGYDGKGQCRLQGGEDPTQIWTDMGGVALLLEGFVEFSAEFSVIMARGRDGTHVFYDSAENTHKEGILDRCFVPASDIVLSQVASARALTSKIADALNYVGVLSVEFFASTHGPIFNEMAPRVHNSGHWTIEGTETSQFANHIRAICGLPLGSTALTGESVEMVNLIGDDAANIAALLSDPHAHVHLYGKAEAREGRKMGHVTWVRR